MKIKTLFVLVFVFWTVFLSAENLTLCYHKFEHSLTDMYSVMPEVFEWQVNYMKEKKLDIIHLKQMVDYYDLGIGSIDNTALITIDDGWKSENNIIPIAVKYNAPVTLYLYKLVLNRSVHYFSYADIDAIKATGMADFGCHSYTHIPLIKKDNATLKHEIIDAKAADERVLKMTLDTFAYPYGMYDSAAKKMVSENFKLAFGVNDGWNKKETDRYNLNRFVIYKSIGFGEFMSYVDRAAGEKENGYAVHFIGTGRDDEGHFNRIKFKVYRFGDKKAPLKALIIPSTGAGPAWAFKLVKKLNEAGFECDVMSGRDSYVPFYNPNEVMKVVRDWGLQETIKDLKQTVDFAVKEGKRPVVFAWGDGFDSFMALLGSDPSYAEKVRGIIVVNPSLAGAKGNVDYYKSEVDRCDLMLSSGKYEESGLDFFLKTKTLLDLMVLKPDDISPFAVKMGYPGATNKILLARFLNGENGPEIGFDLDSMDSLMPDFRQVCMQPSPLMGMVVPVAYVRDLNMLWYGDFYSKELGVEHAREIKLPAVYYFSKAYEDNLKAVKEAFSSLAISGENRWDDESTAEILLDDSFIGKVVPEAVLMHGESVKQQGN